MSTFQNDPFNMLTASCHDRGCVLRPAPSADEHAQAARSHCCANRRRMTARLRGRGASAFMRAMFLQGCRAHGLS